MVSLVEGPRGAQGSRTATRILPRGFTDAAPTIGRTLAIPQLPGRWRVGEGERSKAKNLRRTEIEGKEARKNVSRS